MPSPEEQLASARRTVEDHRKHGRCGSCGGGEPCWMLLWAKTTIAAAEHNASEPAARGGWQYREASQRLTSPWAGG